MRSHLRTIIVLALAFGLLVVFLYNVDLRSVASNIVHANPIWLALSFASMFVNLAIRAWRWQYLLAPLGMPSFGNAFRATTVGFAASAVLPARAGEVIRPYFLSRHEKVSATGAFATVILERLLDMIAVLVLLAFYVFVVRPQLDASGAYLSAVKWTAGVSAAGAVVALAVLFVLAGHPARLGAALGRLEHVLPSAFAGLLAKVAEKFASGLAVVRRPGRLAMAVAISMPLWLSIAFGIWAVAVAFHLAIPFTGSFLVIAFLVVGVAVPTPGAVGGFHQTFRISATTFFGAPDDAAVAAAIVAHLMTIVPALLLGLFFAAQEGLNLTGMKQLAEQQKPVQTT